jgi:hypothetical protein
MRPPLRQRANESDADFERRQQAAEKADQEHAALCDLINEGNAVVYAADALAAQLIIGTANLDDVRELLRTADRSNPYVDTTSLETACMLIGINPHAL